MRTIPTTLGPIALHDFGSEGDPVVLLHANPGSHRDFEAIIPALSARYRVHAPDFPGYGETPPPPDPRAASAFMFADVVEEVVRASNLPAAVFIGNSVGGFAAARLAARLPERVRGLVLVDTGGFTPANLFSRSFCHLKGSERITRRVAGLFARNYLKRRNEWTQAIIDRTVAGVKIPSRVAVDAALWRSFANPDHDLRDEAERIACPTLLAWGRRDPVLRLKTDGRRALAAIPGARLVEFDTGHMPFAEDPQAFLAAVEPFLEEVSRAGQHVASHS